MTDQYGTPHRPLLDEQVLAARLRSLGFTGELPHYSAVTTSTQDVARQLYAIGKRPPYSAVTDEQTAGRGRLARSWTAPPGAALLVTVALPMPTQRNALPLLVGTTVVQALLPFAPQLRLKWPNDVVAVVDGDLRKVGGLIAEVHDDAVLVGIGINVDLLDHELPTPQAISLRQLGVSVEREQVLASVLVALTTWQPPSLADYRPLCITLGAGVQVTMVDGSVRTGTAQDITDDGALVVDGVAISAGDVQHVRSS